jgi:hypothetical protein
MQQPDREGWLEEAGDFRLQTSDFRLQGMTDT